MTWRESEGWGEGQSRRQSEKYRHGVRAYGKGAVFHRLCCANRWIYRQTDRQTDNQVVDRKPGSYIPQVVLNIHWKDWCWSWNSNTLATCCKELTHWKRPWCWERLKAGEGDDRGWDGWMASPTRWTWVWASSGSWRWTGRPGVLQSVGLQSRTRLSDWTDWGGSEQWYWSRAEPCGPCAPRPPSAFCLRKTSAKG